VSPEEITTDLENLRAVKECLTPKNRHEIRSFLGLFMYDRGLISGFTNIAKPPTKLMEEMQAFQWTPEVEVALQTPKEALCTVPILAYMEPSERFVVDTYASNVGIGGMMTPA
jgi:hypothetical protein